MPNFVFLAHHNYMIVSFLSYKGGEEGDGDAGDGEEENSLAQWAGDKRAKPPPKNQFNYAERASQTGLVGFRVGLALLLKEMGRIMLLCRIVQPTRRCLLTKSFPRP